jgi:signal transduction histidine kinase
MSSTDASQLNRVFLNFKQPELEKSYGEWGFDASLKGFYLTLVMSAITFVVMSLLDFFLLGRVEELVLWVRVAALPLTNFSIYLIIRLGKVRSRDVLDFLHAVFIFFSQLWIFWIAFAFPELGEYYLLMNLMFAFLATITFNKLNYRFLMPAIVLIAVVFELKIALQDSITWAEFGYQWTMISMFTSIGLFSGWLIERAERLDYLNNLDISEKQAALLAKNKELEQFAYIASHDLQEPLRSVTSFSQLINEEYRDKIGDTGAQYLDFLMEASGRMRNLIKGLLDYSRLGREAKLSMVDANAVLRDVQVDLSVAIAESKARITVERLPTLLAYETEFRQLVQNLLSNALKFRRKDTAPELRISAQRQGNCWEFAVQDNGIGIAKESQDKIFLIFQRLHNRSQYEGTGIGLANCRKIAELHGGSIRVMSEKNQGSTFYFTIPIRSHA